MSFQFTPLREGRPYIASKAPTDDLFQFTPLREGRRWRGSSGSDPGIYISIHAPA